MIGVISSRKEEASLQISINLEEMTQLGWNLSLNRSMIWSINRRTSIDGNMI
jgi:hypothetical protein